MSVCNRPISIEKNDLQAEWQAAAPLPVKTTSHSYFAKKPEQLQTNGAAYLWD